MGMKRQRFAVIMGVVLAWAPGTLHALCVNGSVSDQKREAGVVFDGTVSEIEPVQGGWAATMDVHRVWKGKVAARVTAYYRISIDGPVFKKGQRAVHFGQIKTGKELPDLPTLIPAGAPVGSIWIPPCSGLSVEDRDSIKKLGRASKPAES